MKVVTEEGEGATVAASRGEKKGKAKSPVSSLSVQRLGWKNWGQNDDEQSQISVSEKILTVPKLL